jgi:FMNH2-dependent dimethyl sulfone monooxygenase
MPPTRGGSNGGAGHDQFARLKEAGIDGLQLSFFDFAPDLDHFGSRILPLMRQAGLRL